VTAGTPITITGTAAETGGGVVAGVEVSVDGGTSWHPTSGTASWSYVWTPASSAQTTIRSRAVDDSGNVESPSAGVTIGGTGAGGCPTCTTIWPGSATPTTASGTDANAVELGVKFRADDDGY